MEAIMKPLTVKQRRMLEILSQWGGMGTIEVTIQYGEYDFGDGEAEESKGRRVTDFVVKNIMRALVKRGLATDNENGYDITDAGREELRIAAEIAEGTRDEIQQNKRKFGHA